MKKIKVLIVDDSLFIRRVLSKIISSDTDLEVVGTAMNGKIAIQSIPHLKPDCITLDIEMPEMDGLTTLKYIMEHFPTPVIIVSSYTRKCAMLTIEALKYGAVDFIHKPEVESDKDFSDMFKDLIQKIKIISDIPLKKISNIETPFKQEIKVPSLIQLTDFPAQKVIAIGVSTGGPNALRSMLPKISPDLKSSILIVQHMPVGFTEEFALILNEVTPVKVREAEDGALITCGSIWIARGDIHLQVRKKRTDEYIISLDNITSKISGHKPSIDVLFSSVAENFASKSMGIIMTGMGRDGATGIGLIRKAGGITIAQDEQSCVIYGMPRVAVEEGNIDKILPLSEIHNEINIFGMN